MLLMFFSCARHYGAVVVTGHQRSKVALPGYPYPGVGCMFPPRVMCSPTQ